MKTLAALILTALLVACGGGEYEQKTVIGEADTACRNSAGVDVKC